MSIDLAALDDDEKADLRDALDRSLAQQSLLDFCKRVTPTFETPPHIVYLAELLERAERGEEGYTRIAISCPPGHGKSVLLQHFSAWFMGRNPKRRVLAISANESLAKRNSRDTQTLLRSDGWPWPETTLATDSVLEWYLKQGGSCRAIGREGVTTGFRLEAAVVDDLQPDAGSRITQESDEAFFRGVLTTRLEPNGIAIVVQTRWSDNDLIARLAEGESGHLWRIVNIPAFAAPNDVLGRAEGEELWKSRWPADKLEQKRIEVGSYAFSAQYLGDPVPSGSAMFQKSWFQRYIELPRLVRTIPNNSSRALFDNPHRSPGTIEEEVGYLAVMGLDAAAKTGVGNDYSAIATVKTDRRNFYITDIIEAKLEFPDLVRRLLRAYRDNRPRVIYVEEASAGVQTIQTLKSETHLPIIGVKPTSSKISRAESVSPLAEAGRVFVPERAPWAEKFIEQCCRFPYGAHDDMLDAVVWCLIKLQELLEMEHQQRRKRAALGNIGNWMLR